MKKFILLVSILFAFGCVTADIASCPPEDAVIGAETPFGIIPLVIPEGAFNDKENWMTKEQFDEKMEQQGGENI